MSDGKLLRLSAERFNLSDDLVLLCLPEWFRAALLDMTHRMLWSRAWTSQDGTERILSESDRRRIEYGIFKLSQEECDMEIINNVNVTCGGCGSSTPTTLYCILSDGTPVITPQPPAPTEPTPPPGSTLPLDPATDPAPEGYEDWTAYDQFACYMANVMWWTLHLIIRLAETFVDIAATLAALVTLLIPLLPAGMVAAIGGATLLDILWQLVQIITSEQASNILNELTDWLEDERQSIVCYLYSHRYDFGAEQGIVMGQRATEYMTQSLQMTTSESTAVERLIAAGFRYTLWWDSVLVGAAQWITGTNEYTDFTAVDCSTCSSLSFRLFDPFTINTLNGVGWNDSRCDAPAGAVNMNSSDVADANFQVSNDLWSSYWGLSTPINSSNARLKFSWRVVNRDNTSGIIATVKARNTSNALQTIADLSSLVSYVQVGAWQSFDQVVPFTFAAGSGANLLEFRIRTFSGNLQIEVDNVDFFGGID